MKFRFGRLGLCLVTLVAAFGMGCSQRSSSQSDLSTPDQIVPRSLEIKPWVAARVSNPGYLGPQSCAECHQGRLEECLSSSHFRTCRTPEPQSMPRGFASGGGTFELPNSDVRFELSRRGDHFFQTAVNKNSPSLLRAVSSIDLILGAGKKSDEVYLSWHPDNTMWELPVAWVYANDCWGASGFDRNSGGDHARALTLRCFECHNTWFEHVAGTISEYRREELILGVTCERCHGPGREHVEYHRSHPNETSSHGILLPSSLPRERLIEVCTQCHGNAIRHHGPALSFRPGQNLDDHYRWVNPNYQEDDHVANQIEYLRESKCFQKSQMTCITCHDPHLTDQPAEGTSFLTNCIDCHQSESCPKQPELPTELRDQCTDCHMRKYVKINVNFDLADDSYVPPARRSQHRIQVDPIGTLEVLLRWHRKQTNKESAEQAEKLERQFVDSWLAVAESYAKSGRYRAAIGAVREALIIIPSATNLKAQLAEYVAFQMQLDSDQSDAEYAMRNNQDHKGKELIDKILERQPDNALMTGKLGTLTAKLGDMKTAKQLFNAVAKLDADEQYGISMLAWFALLEKDNRTAAELYQKADEIEPFNAKIQFLWGESLARAGEYGKAIEHYKISLQCNPRQLETLRSIAAAAAASKDFIAAATYATHVAQLTEYQNVNDLKTLVELYVESGQIDMGRSVLDHIYTLVKNNPRLKNEIQSWATNVVADRR